MSQFHVLFIIQTLVLLSTSNSVGFCFSVQRCRRLVISA